MGVVGVVIILAILVGYLFVTLYVLPRLAGMHPFSLLFKDNEKNPEEQGINKA